MDKERIERYQKGLDAVLAEHRAAQLAAGFSERHVQAYSNAAHIILALDQFKPRILGSCDGPQEARMCNHAVDVTQEKVFQLLGLAVAKIVSGMTDEMVKAEVDRVGKPLFDLLEAMVSYSRKADAEAPRILQ